MKDVCMKVSIVVPVYNVASCVERCLDSVCSQTYPNIECVLVDDCGTDDSMAVVRKKLDGYTGAVDFTVVRHEKNRGLSAARNTGTAVATGEYVYYLDSDDLLLPDSIEKLSNPLKRERFDFVVGNYASGGDSMIYLPLNTEFDISHSGSEILHSYVNNQWYVMAWNKLVRRCFLEENDIRFREGLLHEDHPWSFEIACTAKSMCVVNAITYVYFLRQGSIVNSLSRKNLDAWVMISDENEAIAVRYRVTADPAVARFLINMREKLADRAKPYGWRLGFFVYCEHVRRHLSDASPCSFLSKLEAVRYLHHRFSPRVGYIYYSVIFRLICCVYCFAIKCFCRLNGVFAKTKNFCISGFRNHE